jgi:hypothetical protein
MCNSWHRMCYLGTACVILGVRHGIMGVESVISGTKCATQGTNCVISGVKHDFADVRCDISGTKCAI